MRPVLLLVTALLAAGCTAAVEGTPSAEPPAPLPVRPREVRLEGVDPCALLTVQQRRVLGLDSKPSASRPYVALFRGEVPTCTVSGSRPGSNILGVGAVTSVGVERWREGDIAAQLRPVIVEGFPALIAAPAQSAAYCGVEVDVAPGQLLDVQLLDGGANPPAQQRELCERAEQAAGEIIKTLLAH